MLSIVHKPYLLYSIVNRGFYFFFHHFVRLIIKGGLPIFISLLYRKVDLIDDAQSFLGYILPTKLSMHGILFRIVCTLRHRRYYDKQEADVVVKHHYPGYE